jgi:hypothetical protein
MITVGTPATCSVVVVGSRPAPPRSRHPRQLRLQSHGDMSSNLIPILHDGKLTSVLQVNPLGACP